MMLVAIVLPIFHYVAADEVDYVIYSEVDAQSDITIQPVDGKSALSFVMITIARTTLSRPPGYIRKGYFSSYTHLPC